MVEDTPRAINRENIRLVKAVELMNITLQATELLLKSIIKALAFKALSYRKEIFILEILK